MSRYLAVAFVGITFVAPVPAADPSKPAADARVKVCLVSGSLEYKSDQSLAGLQEHLEKTVSVECSRAFRKTDTDLPGLESLSGSDVMLLFTRRLTPPAGELDRVKRYCESGKGVVGVRTASHAFQNWPELDREVFGGDYRGHYGHDLAPTITPTETAKGHPLLTGVGPIKATGGLYKNPKPAEGVEVLLTGTIPGHTEPVAWVRTRKDGGRSFYTSLGHPADFDDPNFRRLLTNAVLWAGKRDVPQK